MIHFRALAAAAALLCLTSPISTASAENGEVNVYTYRETKLIQPLFDAFTKDTGIKVNVVSASSGLEQRMTAEGTNSPGALPAGRTGCSRPSSAVSTKPSPPA